MTHIRLSVLGSPILEREGERIELDTRKALALFVYLVVTDQHHSRDSLATMLWPEHDQTQGRTYLRRALWMLKRALGDEPFSVGRQSLGIDMASGFWLDVAEFRRLLATCDEHTHERLDSCEECLALLTEAVDFYKGDFLTGFTLPDAPEFDDWQFFQTEGLRQDMVRTLDLLVASYTNHKNYETAIAYART